MLNTAIPTICTPGCSWYLVVGLIDQKPINVIGLCLLHCVKYWHLPVWCSISFLIHC